jgi:hypothetical protein
LHRYVTGAPQEGVTVSCILKPEEKKLLSAESTDEEEKGAPAAAAAPAPANGGVFTATTNAQGMYSLEVGEGSYEVGLYRLNAVDPKRLA